MNKILIALLIAIIIFIAGFFTAKKVSPTIKTETVEKEVERVVVKKDIKIITRTIRDGQVVEEKEERDNSVITKDSLDEKKSTATANLIKETQWHVSIATNKLSNLDKAKYNLQIERRILGNLYLGANVNTANEYMLSIGMGF